MVCLVGLRYGTGHDKCIVYRFWFTKSLALDMARTRNQVQDEFPSQAPTFIPTDDRVFGGPPAEPPVSTTFATATISHSVVLGSIADQASVNVPESRRVSAQGASTQSRERPETRRRRTTRPVVSSPSDRVDVSRLPRIPSTVNGRGPWQPCEDERLRALVNMCGVGAWPRIAQYMVNRTGKQCRERYINNLAPGIVKTEWTQSDERRLVQLQSIYGNRWSLIAKEFPGRTDNAVKNRFNSYLRRLEYQRRQQEEALRKEQLLQERERIDEENRQRSQQKRRNKGESTRSDTPVVAALDTGEPSCTSTVDSASLHLASSVGQIARPVSAADIVKEPRQKRSRGLAELCVSHPRQRVEQPLNTPQPGRRDANDATTRVTFLHPYESELDQRIEVAFLRSSPDSFLTHENALGLEVVSPTFSDVKSALFPDTTSQPNTLDNLRNVLSEEECSLLDKYANLNFSDSRERIVSVDRDETITTCAAETMAGEAEQGATSVQPLDPKATSATYYDALITPVTLRPNVLSTEQPGAERQDTKTNTFDPYLPLVLKQ